LINSYLILLTIGSQDLGTLYRHISALIADAAQEYNFKQVPEYAPIRHAGHSAGEFFFYPKEPL
jgi:hypothetical protein